MIPPTAPGKDKAAAGPPTPKHPWSISLCCQQEDNPSVIPLGKLPLTPQAPHFRRDKGYLECLPTCSEGSSRRQTRLWHMKSSWRSVAAQENPNMEGPQDASGIWRIPFSVMEKASGLVRRSYRETDLGSLSLPRFHRGQQPRLRPGPTRWCPRAVFAYLFIPSLL